MPADEAEGSSEALYQVKFDEGLLSWKGKVKVIREGKLIHILGWSMLSLDDAGNIIRSKKKKRDEQPSSDDDADVAALRAQKNRESSQAVQKPKTQFSVDTTPSARRSRRHRREQMPCAPSTRRQLDRMGYGRIT